MIREFKENDLNNIMKLWLHTNTLAHDFIDIGYWKSNYDKVKQMMPEAIMFVYEEDNLIKGFVGFTVHNKQIDENTNEVELVMSWNAE